MLKEVFDLTVSDNVLRAIILQILYWLAECCHIGEIEFVKFESKQTI